MKKYLILLIILGLSQPILSQKESNLLKKHEITLLNILLSDTVNDANFIIGNQFNFGIENQLFTSSNIVKKGKTLYIQPLGTGRLYQVLKKGESISINRIDQTIHSGVNFYSQNFFIHDTLYQYGGIGFWNIRGIVSYFSDKTKQWEIVQANKAVSSFFDETRDAILHYNDDLPDPKMYVSNAYYYLNYPKSFEAVATDSCYEYNFNKREWKTLGKINPQFKSIFDNKKVRSIELHSKSILFLQSQLEFYWVDFEKNLVGNLKTAENDRLKTAWLAFYNDNANKQQIQLQFILGNDLYFAKMQQGSDLAWIKYEINTKELDLNNTFHIYSNKKSIWQYLNDFISLQKGLVISFLLLLVALFIIRKSIIRKRKMPKELSTILYQNFFNSLTIVEKEIIESLYNSYQKGEEVSTKTINKILGVQQKDVLNQNKTRSDHFIKISQKFKMSTQNTDPLFVKTRDHTDKRQYNYSINPSFVENLAKLIKD